MKFELKLALRNARARRKSLARFTSLVAIVGIAAGVASLIVAQALANGFADEMRDKILANTPHISVSANDGAEISDWRAAKTAVEKIENARVVLPTAYANALVAGKDATSYATLRAVENSNLETRNSGEIEISLGARLAEKINLNAGDAAEIITSDNQTSPQKTIARVADTFQTGLYDYDSTWINISPENFARLQSKREFTPTVLSVSVEDIYKADETAARMRELLGENFTIVDWQQANQPLFAALALERRFAFAVISLIIFIAALNIAATLALLVDERRFEIAILMTCGARRASLVLIFLFEGLFLGFAGIASGVVLGLLACALGNEFKIISLSAEVYALDSIPFHADFVSVSLTVFAAFVLCLTATVYPAYKASRVKPLENLRTR